MPVFIRALALAFVTYFIVALIVGGLDPLIGLHPSPSTVNTIAWLFAIAVFLSYGEVKL